MEIFQISDAALFNITFMFCIADVKELHYTDTASVAIKISQELKHHETHFSSCLIMTLTPWLLTHVSLICELCESVMNSHLLALQFRASPPTQKTVITVIRNHLCLIISLSLALALLLPLNVLHFFICLFFSFKLRLLSIFISQWLRFLFDHNLNRHRP